MSRIANPGGSLHNRAVTDAREQVRELAWAAGFDLVGFAPLRRPRGAERLLEWLAAGRQAGMGWLRDQAPDTLAPERLLPGGRSLVMLGLGHSRDAFRLADGSRVARYAAGRDYHNVIGRKLIRLGKQMARAGLVKRWRKFADAGPLLERSHAAEAGLGYESKAANLLHPRFGPWYFLAELLVDAEFEPEAATNAVSCGSCTACIDACPTQAIGPDGVVDARACISYHTIESREPVPRELRAGLGAWVFGCDVCSEVCPWGARAPSLAERFGTHAALAQAHAADWLQLTEPEFAQRFEGSALRRAGAAGLARNAAHALGSLEPDERDRAALLSVLDAHASELVRTAAAWALARRYRDDRGTLAALERAAAREPVDAARDDMRENFSSPGVAT